MKKVISTMLIYVLSIFFLFTRYPLIVNATINIDTSCSLTLEYQHGEKKFNDLDIKIIRVAEISEDGTYSMINDFSKYPINIDGISSQKEWNLIASTLSAYVYANKIPSTQIQKTNNSGVVSFNTLQTGLYLVLPVNFETSTEIYTFDAFLISLPNNSKSDTLVYDVIAKPKSKVYENKSNDIEYKVVKHWKDNGYVNQRPKDIQVDILKNGIIETTQTLSSKNNWSYSWKSPNDGSIWQVVERNVPNNYTVTSVNNGTTIIITNTYNYNNENPPNTGNTANLSLYITIMGIVGVFFIILGVNGKRKNYE